MVRKIMLLSGIVILLMTAGTIASGATQTPLIKNPEPATLLLMGCAVIAIRMFRKSLK